MNKPPRKQKSASDCPDLKVSKSKQTGTEILSAKDFRKKYANKESGLGGLQDQVDGYLRNKGLTFIRIADSILTHLAICWNIPEGQRIEMKISVSGIPDNNVFIPILGTKFNLAVCIENKSKTGTVKRKQERFADNVNVVVCRSKEDAIALIEEAEKYLETINEH